MKTLTLVIETFRAECQRRGVDPALGAAAGCSYAIVRMKGERRSRLRRKAQDDWWKLPELWKGHGAGSVSSVEFMGIQRVCQQAQAAADALKPREIVIVPIAMPTKVIVT